MIRFHRSIDGKKKVIKIIDKKKPFFCLFFGDDLATTLITRNRIDSFGIGDFFFWRARAKKNPTASTSERISANQRLRLGSLAGGGLFDAAS